MQLFCAKNHILGGGVIVNRGGWKSLTRKFEFTKNLHEFERITAIWENILESLKKCQAKKNQNFSSIRVLKFEANFHILGNKGSLVEIYFSLGAENVYLAIFFILIWFEALVILHRCAKIAKLKKFSDTSTGCSKSDILTFFYQNVKTSSPLIK